jgi:hypothetical protein
MSDYYAECERVRETNGWQPIETAPKDRTPVLIAGGTVMWLLHPYPDDMPLRVVALAYRDGDEWDDGDGAYTYKPTHWMPLPAPPKT